jgi:hypothetical protein
MLSFPLPPLSVSFPAPPISVALPLVSTMAVSFPAPPSNFTVPVKDGSVTMPALLPPPVRITILRICAGRYPLLIPLPVTDATLATYLPFFAETDSTSVCGVPLSVSVPLASDIVAA